MSNDNPLTRKPSAMKTVADVVVGACDLGAAPGLVVAVDGPSGSGKSSVSREAARRLGLAYLDTGAMYRALTWSCLDLGIELGDQELVAAHARELKLPMPTNPDDQQLRVRGHDLTAAIRQERISAAVSKVATNLQVRQELAARQRAIIESAATGAGIVAEGRDITSVVAPDAPVRVLLTAAESLRIQRRARQLSQTGAQAAPAEHDLRDTVVRRDREDATVSQFDVAVAGVHTVDTSELDFEASVAAVMALATATRQAR